LSEMVENLENDEGDLTARIDNNSKDEVGQMINGINQFLDALQNAIVSIKSGSNRITITSENMSSQIMESKTSTTEISASLNDLSASMEEIISKIQRFNIGAQDVSVSYK